MKVQKRQEAIDNLLLPYRKMSMAVKAARWELERLARPAQPSMDSIRSGARSDR